jgi:hypothetical protein
VAAYVKCMDECSMYACKVYVCMYVCMYICIYIFKMYELVPRTAAGHPW